MNTHRQVINSLLAAHQDHQPLESPFAPLWLRTDAAERYTRVDRATAVIWRFLSVAEGRFQRLKGAALLPAVYQGGRCAVQEAQGQVLEEVAA